MKTLWLSLILASLTLTACANNGKAAMRATAIDAPPPHVQETSNDSVL